MSNSGPWADIPVGSSGHPELERAWLAKAKEIFELFCQKQRSYGPGNIQSFRDVGVVIRVSDKIQRLKKAYFGQGLREIKSKCPHCGELIVGETLRDTWMDLADYGIIGLLCLDGDWPGVEEAS